jgi:hypothetical protein
MKKTNFIYALSVLVISSCGQSTDKDVDEVENFQFPRITDVLNNDTLELTSKVWLNHGNHEPYYFGKLTDSISIERYLRPMIPPPPPPGIDTSEWDLKPRKGKFDSYFLDWMDDRSYKYIDSAKLSIKIDTSQIINNDFDKAFPVLIQNTSIDTICIGLGGHISIIAEAKDENGQWKPIERGHAVGCSTGVHTIILPPNQYVLTSQLVYSGNFKTKLRIKMGNNYSEEFNGTINKSQFNYK